MKKLKILCSAVALMWSAKCLRGRGNGFPVNSDDHNDSSLSATQAVSQDQLVDKFLQVRELLTIDIDELAPTLKELRIYKRYYERIGNDEFEKLSLLLSGAINLQSLDLGNNELTSLPREIWNLINLDCLFLDDYNELDQAEIDLVTTRRSIR